MLGNDVTLERLPALDDREAQEIAVEAYTYAYPMILMDVTRRVTCNVEAPDRERGAGAPVNQLTHVRQLPDATSQHLPRPNPDTLHSSLWFDVSDEPLVVSVPDASGRFHSLSLLDYWSDVFASPSTRTTGKSGQIFGIVGPGWQGQLPAGIRQYRSPTALGWLLAETAVDGAGDIANVARFQAGFSVTPASAWGQLYTPARGGIDASVPTGEPTRIVARLRASQYFSRFCELTRHNPPHPHDYPLLDRMSRIGLVPGQKLELAALAPNVRRALEKAPMLAIPAFKEAYEQMGQQLNHWRSWSKPRGVYGTDYTLRAGVALAALGAPANEELSSYHAAHDASGDPLDSSLAYALTFSKYALPPAKAFWSLSLYDDRQLLADNPFGRHAVGDRHDLAPNGDDSVTIHIQRSSPGTSRGKRDEQNWLPSPRSGGFSLGLRLYWPGLDALTGHWAPPPIRRVE